MDIKSINNKIKSIYKNFILHPADTIAGIFILCSAAKRPGLSVILSTANVIAALKKKGIPTEVAEDGTPNYTCILVHEIIQELYRAIREDMQTQVALDPQSLTSIGVGANAGGPMTLTVFNHTVGHGSAISR